MKWTALSVPIAILAGSASAGFLFALERVTDWREAHVWVISLLPLSGFVVGLIYHHYGQDVAAGNTLLVDEVHDPKKVVPLRMAPLVLIGTLMTHLFGGSAGREGTAVQMGGSLADQLSKPFRMDVEDRRILLMAGIAAGFGSVFGTPLAGAVFGLEVLLIVEHRFRGLVPCFVSAVLADQVTRRLGIHHTAYQIAEMPALSFHVILAVLGAGAIFGVTGMSFGKTTHAITHFFKSKISYGPLRPVIGGTVVALGVWALGTTKYIGIGVPTIVDAFAKPLAPWDFALKFAFTALTLGSGFKGGEVTPLMFIGAALGNVLGPLFGVSSALLAGLGLVAVFSGAARTPFSSVLLAIELFGPKVGIYAAVACIASHLCSGKIGIYHSPHVAVMKTGTPKAS